MGIPRAAKYSDDVMVVGGNPFTNEVFRQTPDGVIRKATRLPCARCGKNNCDFLRCMLPVRAMPRKWVFIHGLGQNTTVQCHTCGKDVGSKNHWPRYPVHAVMMTRLFWNRIARERHKLPVDLLNALVLWVGLGGEG